MKIEFEGRILAAIQKVVIEFNSNMQVETGSPLGLAIIELDIATDEILGRHDLPTGTEE